MQFFGTSISSIIVPCNYYILSYATPLLTWERTARPSRRSCPTLIPPFAKSLSGSISLQPISRVPFIKPLSHASRRNTAALPLRSVGSGCIPVQRWECLAQKLPRKNSCVVYLEILFTKELLPSSPTIYTAEPTYQKSYCTLENEWRSPVSRKDLMVWWSTHVIKPSSFWLFCKPVHLPPPPRWSILDHHRRCYQNSRNWCYPERNP